MSKIPTVALIGAGNRGKDSYGVYGLYAKDRINFTAVVDPNEVKRVEFITAHEISEDKAFDNLDDFFAKGKIADAVIIANQDKQHFEPTMKALELGYDVLLEKPMSPDPVECIKMNEKAKETGNLLMICHVLRYTPFFTKIKEIIDSGEIGDVVNIQLTENIGNFHYAHSYVRGNWRNTEKSSPIILAKSCHDLDIISWLVDSKCTSLSSYGDLKYFKRENAPKESTERCLDCPLGVSCRFHGLRAYGKTMHTWPTNVITTDQTQEGLLKALRETDYGKCVWKVDANDVCDNQVVAMHFENNVTATFTLSAFSTMIHRQIKVFGTDGEITGDDLFPPSIKVNKFAGNFVEESVVTEYYTERMLGSHGGGDIGLMNAFTELLASDDRSALRTSSEESMQSHMMCFAAEESRLDNKVVSIEEFIDRISCDE